MFFQQLKRAHEDWIGVAPNGEVGKSFFASPISIHSLSEGVVMCCCASICHSCTVVCQTHIRAGAIRCENS